MSDKRKKSFVLHIDSLDILDDLEDEQVANLFRAIKAFQNDEEPKLDAMTKLVFLPFKNQFIRDNDKYEETRKRRAEAGSKGGKAKVANASKPKQKVAKQAKLADSDNKSGSVSDSDSGSVNGSENIDLISDKSDAISVLNYMNESLGTKYKSTTVSHIENINGRLSEGHSVEDCKLVIDSKKSEWINDPKMAGYLRPQTLFQAGKFQGYLMAAKTSPVKSSHNLANKNYISEDL
jgi:uncharacterized phage protein (TIGR02220 family)